MKIAIFGSSILSAYWNGAATYYRGIVRALSKRGHEVTFYEPDAFGRQQHRDLEPPPWCRVEVYQPTEEEALRCVEEARHADLLVKTSGVGVLDDVLERAVAHLGRNLTAFWDVDAPATLAKLEAEAGNPLNALIPLYDMVLTYGGGDPVVARYQARGARHCLPVYNALDPRTHHPVDPREEFGSKLSLLANRLPDREARVEEFFFRAAPRVGGICLLGGSGWEQGALPPNVRHLGHVKTADHNAFNCSALAVLNICRDSMASNGYSPATRVFEAAGAGACLITDAWEGVELFLEPDREILVAGCGEEVAEHVNRLTSASAAAIGRRARTRMLAEHTYDHRAAELETFLASRTARTAEVW